MKRFLVDYKVRHQKEFWVNTSEQIITILNEYNQCGIISITELPSDFSITNQDGN